MQRHSKKKKLLWLIGIPIIAFGLGRWGMYWYVKQKLDQLILDESSSLTIEYTGLETSLQGRIDVSGITVVPVGQSEGFTISRVSVRGPDVLTYVLNHNFVTGDKGPPQYLDISINGLQLDLTSELVGSLDREYKVSVQNDTAASTNCDQPGSMSLGMLRDMGLETLVGDGRLYYRYDEVTRTLKSDIELNIENIQSGSMGVIFADVSPQAVKSSSPGIPSLSELRLSMTVRPFFGKKMSLYCADQAGLTVAKYEERAAAGLMQNLADNGIILGRGLQLAVRSYYTNWGKIDFSAKPARPVNLLALMFKPPTNIQQTLGLQLAINDRTLTDLSFRLQRGARLFSSSEPLKKKKPRAPKPRYQMIWKRVEPVKLQQHLDRKVKLYMADRILRTGILMGINGAMAEVEQRVSGGKLTAHVPLRNISRAEVEVRMRINPPSTPKKADTEQTDTEQTDAEQAEADTQQG